MSHVTCIVLWANKMYLESGSGYLILNVLRPLFVLVWRSCSQNYENGLSLKINPKLMAHLVLSLPILTIDHFKIKIFSTAFHALWLKCLIFNNTHSVFISELLILLSFAAVERWTLTDINIKLKVPFFSRKPPKSFSLEV